MLIRQKIELNNDEDSGGLSSNLERRNDGSGTKFITESSESLMEENL